MEFETDQLTYSRLPDLESLEQYTAKMTLQSHTDAEEHSALLANPAQNYGATIPSGQTISLPDADNIPNITTRKTDVRSARPPGELVHPSDTAEAILSPKYQEAGVGFPRGDGSGVVLDKKALMCLYLQHVSSTTSTNCYRFSVFIFLAEVYKTSLAPASLTGLASFTAGLLFAGYIGGIVDRMPKLQFLRRAVAGQKTLVAANNALFLILFGPIGKFATATLKHTAPSYESRIIYLILSLTIATSAGIYVLDVGINVAVEKDLVTTIAQGDSALLTKLNATMTSIDLLSRISSPMIVSLATMTLGYPGAAKFLICFSLASLFIEYFWLAVVYEQFPILKRADITRAKLHSERQEQARRHQLAISAKATNGTTGLSSNLFSIVTRRCAEVKAAVGDDIAMWREFANMPVSLTSLAQSLTWLTSLHFDAVGVAHFKMSAGYSDIFLAAMRILCMVSCLVGTGNAARVERRFGTRRSGTLGLSLGIACFIPCTIAFFFESHFFTHPHSTPARINTAVMFSGIILARAGHTIFDLSQIKQIQQKLQDHPRRNKCMSYQSSLQSLFGLLKFVVMIVFSKKEQYKWSVLITLLANLGAMSSWLLYLNRVRGEKA